MLISASSRLVVVLGAAALVVSSCKTFREEARPTDGGNGGMLGSLPDAAGDSIPAATGGTGIPGGTGGQGLLGGAGSNGTGLAGQSGASGGKGGGSGSLGGTPAASGGAIGSGGAGGRPQTASGGVGGKPAGGSGGVVGPGSGGVTPGTGGASGTGGVSATGGAAVGGTAAGGRGGKGGSPAASGGSTVDDSVLERNKHASRDGHFLQPTLTKAAAQVMALDTDFNATFTGSMWASPLYFQNGPGGKGIFIAVTFGNDVFALDETTGAIVWQKNIGTPASAMVGCTGISGPTPLGILSTPVIDAASGTIFVAGAIGTGQGVTANIVTALDVQTGAVKAGWPVDVSTKLAFDPKLHQQRSALSLVGGTLYVAYGGFVGDCGDYRGRVVAIKVSDPTQVAGWSTGGRGEGIWPPGGLASDGSAVFAATGNTTSGGAARADSESIVRITGMATVNKTDAKNYFYPTNFAAMDTGDADLSASNPVFFQVPGATPSKLVAAFSKDGHMFLLDADNLGGMGNQLSETMLSNGTMSLFATPTVYSTATGVRVALSPKGGSICPSGGGAGAIMAVAISAASPPKGTALWCAPVGGTAGQPIATTTDGKSSPIVWIMNGTRLNAFDGETGESITTGGTGTCTSVRRWTSPIAVHGRIIVGGDGHLCSWSPH